MNIFKRLFTLFGVNSVHCLVTVCFCGVLNYLKASARNPTCCAYCQNPCHAVTPSGYGGKGQLSGHLRSVMLHLAIPNQVKNTSSESEVTAQRSDQFPFW